jgi:hypothetical protein
MGTVYSVDRILDDWKGKGPDNEKVILGLPLFSVSFQNTDGLGKPFGSVTNLNHKDLPSTGDLDGKAGATSRYESRVSIHMTPWRNLKLRPSISRKRALQVVSFGRLAAISRARTMQSLHLQLTSSDDKTQQQPYG